MVGSGARRTALASTPSSAHSSKAPSPNESSPTAVRNVTSAPRRAAPTAWFDPFPPWSVRNSDPISVSPRSGARSTPKVSPTP